MHFVFSAAPPPRGVTPHTAHRTTDTGHRTLRVAPAPTPVHARANLSRSGAAAPSPLRSYIYIYIGFMYRVYVYKKPNRWRCTRLYCLLYIVKLLGTIRLSNCTCLELFAMTKACDCSIVCNSHWFVNRWLVRLLWLLHMFVIQSSNHIMFNHWFDQMLNRELPTVKCSLSIMDCCLLMFVNCLQHLLQTIEMSIIGFCSIALIITYPHCRIVGSHNLDWIIIDLSNHQLPVGNHWECQCVYIVLYIMYCIR